MMMKEFEVEDRLRKILGPVVTPEAAHRTVTTMNCTHTVRQLQMQ